MRETDRQRFVPSLFTKDSSNSSKRPSSDDITKPKGGKKPKGADEKGNKIGGQPGHPNIKFLTTLPDEPTRAYGEKLLDAVKGMFRVIHQHETLAPEDFRAELEQAKAKIIHIGIEAAPSLLDEEGKEQRREAQNRQPTAFASTLKPTSRSSPHPAGRSDPTFAQGAGCRWQFAPP